MYFTNFTNPLTSWIRLVGQADAAASGTHTLTLPQATGTLALTSDIPTTSRIFNTGIEISNGSTSGGFIDFSEDTDDGAHKLTLYALR